MAGDVREEYKKLQAVLGPRIKQLRKDRAWSLRDMIVLHGVHEAQWRRFERGGAVNVPSLIRIAMIFETSVSKLLEGLGEFHGARTEEVSSKGVPQKTMGAGKIKAVKPPLKVDAK